MRSFAPARLAAASVLLLLVARAAGAQPAEAARILEELGLPADTRARVTRGEMVRSDLAPSNERELAVGLAFLVTAKPRVLAEEVRKGILTKLDANVEGEGALSGDGSSRQLAGLQLGELADAYRDAGPGEALNLSTAEIRELQASKQEPLPKLEAKVRKQLLERYRAYRRAGLEGIAPYDRGGKQLSGAADLWSASEAASALKDHVPEFYDTLLHYPKKPSSGLQEAFDWQRYRAEGKSSFVLNHTFTLHEGGGSSAALRQYYVSSGYNVEQAIVVFLPVSEGTLVVYLERASTDQIEGFGGRLKQFAGKRAMVSQLEALFARFEKAARR